MGRSTHPESIRASISKFGTDGLSSFYLGKKVAFVYRGQNEKRGTKIRVVWGRVTRPHGKYHESLRLCTALGDDLSANRTSQATLESSVQSSITLFPRNLSARLFVLCYTHPRFKRRSWAGVGPELVGQGGSFGCFRVKAKGTRAFGPGC